MDGKWTSGRTVPKGRSCGKSAENCPENRVVAPAGPATLSAGSEQRVDLWLGEVCHQVALGPLVRDRQHALDRGGVFGVLQREVCE